MSSAPRGDNDIQLYSVQTAAIAHPKDHDGAVPWLQAHRDRSGSGQ
jgi:hypothetical protein